MSIADPRHYTDIILQVPEGEAFDEVHMAQSLEEIMQRIEVALDFGAGEHVVSRNVAQVCGTTFCRSWRCPYPE